MRQSRIREVGKKSYYHCMSRVVDRQHLFHEVEKEHFVALMRKLEAFHGIRVVTYVVMSNHFHLLIEQPDQEVIDCLDAETITARVRGLYDETTAKSLTQELARAKKGGHEGWEGKILNRYRNRMGNVSIFMKDLKQRFSSWYNRNNGRTGTLWEGRFKSVLVEGEGKALLTMAAYIDLNPVRAGMVAKVEDYRWCGYASAVGGNRWARRGLGRILTNAGQINGEDFEEQWPETAKLYRLMLYREGEEREVAEPGGKAVKKGFKQSEVAAEETRKGKMGISEALRHRVRYLTDGGVLGSAKFVNEFFARNRGMFGKRRQTGARSMHKADWGGLHVLRDLQDNLLIPTKASLQ